jgi:hypothetical protein
MIALECHRYDFDSAPKPHQCGLHGIGVAPGGVDETIHLGCSFSGKIMAGCQDVKGWKMC